MKSNDTNCTRSDLVNVRDLFEAKLAQIHTLIDANDKTYRQQFNNIVESTRTALTSTDKRFEGVNEFRQTLSDQAALFIIRTEFELVVSRLEQDIKNLQLARVELIPRVEALGLFKSMDDKFKEIAGELATLREARSEGTGRGKGLDDGWKYLIGAVSLVGAILGIVIFFSK